MRHFLNPWVILLLLVHAHLFAVENPNTGSWKMVPEQRVDRQYVRNFPFQHDKGFYLSMSLGPQWNQAIQNPSASGLRFGGQLGIGFVPVRNLAVYANFWGNFLEQASLLAAGPGVTYFLGDSNVGLGAALGIGSVFGDAPNNKTFRETVLATELSAGKYWWLSKNNSLGLTFVIGLYGLTLSQGSFNSVGWNTGLRLAYVFN